MASPDMQHLAHFPAEISTCLLEGQVQEAKKLAAEVVLCPEALCEGLSELERLFRKGRRLELLIEVLWENKDVALTDMFVVGHFMRFCNMAGVYDRFGPLLRSWIASGSPPEFTFSERGHFRYFRKLTDEQKRDFADAKYRRWKDFASLELFRALDEFSVFATISRPVTEFLFENRADKDMTFSLWRRDLQSSELWKHVLADMRTLNRLNRKSGSSENIGARYPHFDDLSEVMDLERSKAFFAQLDLSRGLLLCTIHDAHLLIAKRCAGLCMPERYSLGLYATGRRGIAVGKGSNVLAASFKAVKVLQAKKMLLMVADAGARKAKQTSQAKILGTPVTFADGAPTFAFESGCATGWYTMAREGDRFVPVVEPGPSREPKESFKSFRVRWWEFYAAQVEKLFTGDPRNITLWFFWPKLLRSATSATPFDDDEDESDYTA